MQINFHHFERMQSLNLNWEVDFRLYGRHLEKSIWSQNSAVVRPIAAEFCRRMQNDMRIIPHRPKLNRVPTTLQNSFSLTFPDKMNNFP